MQVFHAHYSIKDKKTNLQLSFTLIGRKHQSDQGNCKYATSCITRSKTSLRSSASVGVLQKEEPGKRYRSKQIFNIVRNAEWYLLSRAQPSIDLGTQEFTVELLGVFQRATQINLKNNVLSATARPYQVPLPHPRSTPARRKIEYEREHTET